MCVYGCCNLPHSKTARTTRLVANTFSFLLQREKRYNCQLVYCELISSGSGPRRYVLRCLSQCCGVAGVAAAVEDDDDDDDDDQTRILDFHVPDNFNAQSPKAAPFLSVSRKSLDPLRTNTHSRSRFRRHAHLTQKQSAAVESESARLDRLRGTQMQQGEHACVCLAGGLAISPADHRIHTNAQYLAISAHTHAHAQRDCCKPLSALHIRTNTNVYRGYRIYACAKHCATLSGVKTMRAFARVRFYFRVRVFCAFICFVCRTTADPEKCSRVKLAQNGF